MLNLNKLGARVSAFAVSFGTSMMASAAMAQDVNDVITTSGAQLQNVGDLVNIVCYGGGAVLAGTGLLNFKKHVDNPGQAELRKAIGPGVVGVALLAFPTVAGILQESINVDQVNANTGFQGNAFNATMTN